MDSFWHHTYGNGTDGGRNEDEHKRRGHPRRMFEIDQAGTFPLGVEQGFKTSNQCYGVHETGFMTSSDPTLAHQRAFSPAAADGRWVSQDPPGYQDLSTAFNSASVHVAATSKGPDVGPACLNLIHEELEGSATAINQTFHPTMRSQLSYGTPSNIDVSNQAKNHFTNGEGFSGQHDTPTPCHFPTFPTPPFSPYGAISYESTSYTASLEPAELAAYNQHVAPFVPVLRDEMSWEEVEAQAMLAVATLEAGFGGLSPGSVPHTQAVPPLVKHEVARPEVREAATARRTASAKWVCKVCGNDFTRRFNLVYHLNSHAGLKEHRCASCSREFVRKHDLQRHAQSKACPGSSQPGQS